jgi:hypothetical protein
MKAIVAIGLAAALSACALPETMVKTGSARPQLTVKGAPGDAVLVVDGLTMGLAGRYDGNPNTLVIEEGLHQVDIQRAGKSIHSEKTFVSSGETRVININVGVQ